MPRKKTAPRPPAPAQVETPDLPARSPEQWIEAQLGTVQTSVRRSLDDLAAHTQRHPHQALLAALGTGYMLRVLPTGRILAGVVRLALALLKPAALIYGGSKLWHAMQKSAPPHSTQEVS